MQSRPRRAEIVIVSSQEEMGRALHKTYELLRARGATRPHRDAMVFDGSKLYITKPVLRHHWTAAAALNDADTIASAPFLFPAQPRRGCSQQSLPRLRASQSSWSWIPSVVRVGTPFLST